MYKKIFLALIAICGLFLVVGCHNDSDEEIGYYSAIPWNYTHDIFEVTTTNVAGGKAYFSFNDDFDYDIFKNDGHVYVALKAPTKWFYAQEWSSDLQVGAKIKISVEKVEFFVPNSIHLGLDPDEFHFYIKPVETE